MSANDHQVGANHYRNLRQQHWDRLVEMFQPWPGARPYFVGCITKYLERFWKKNGIEDLRKARHYLDKLIELEEAHAQERYSCGCVVQPSKKVQAFCPTHNKPLEESHDSRRVPETSSSDGVRSDSEPSPDLTPIYESDQIVHKGATAGYPA
jgi:hypothetical protein